MEQVKSFVYLGALLTEDGRSDKEVVRRISIAKRSFENMSNILTCHDLSITTKIRLTKCYIWSTLLYGCETWSLTTTLEKKLSAFEMWIYRRISRTSWTEKKTNQEVLDKVKVKRKEITNTIRVRKAKYFGHIKRHESLQRTILEGKIEGKRGRGRRTTSWTGNIEAYVRQPINICGRLVQDRRKWRTSTSNLGNETEHR